MYFAQIISFSSICNFSIGTAKIIRMILYYTDTVTRVSF